MFPLRKDRRISVDPAIDSATGSEILFAPHEPIPPTPACDRQKTETASKPQIPVLEITWALPAPKGSLPSSLYSARRSLADEPAGHVPNWQLDRGFVDTPPWPRDLFQVCWFLVVASARSTTALETRIRT